MKLWMRIATPLTLVMGIGVQANAQYAMMNANYGTGMPYQQCPYNQSVGDGGSIYIEDIKQAKKDLAQYQKDLAAKKRGLTRLENTDIKRNQSAIDKVISADFTDVLYEHMDNGYDCESYRGGKPPENTMAAGQEGNKEISQAEQAKGKDIAEKGKHPFKPYNTSDWYGEICNADKPGSVNSAACTLDASREEGVNRSQIDSCKKALGDYRKNRNAANKLSREIDALTEQIENSKAALQTAQENYRDEQRYGTEGGACPECDIESNAGRVAKPDYLASGVSLAVGGIAAALGYGIESSAIKSNAKLGFPSQPGQALYTALGFGAPFLMNGLYGALGGQMGAGAFGCAGVGGAGAGGIFGNPYGLMGNGIGGGMFLPGMNGMINPYIAANGYMMGNMMGGMMGAMMGGGYPMGGMMGMPMGAMISGGGMIGGGYPMGAMMGSMMGGGYPMGGMMGMPMGAMISGGGMIGGGYPMGAMMGSMMGGGYPMGGMMGMPMGAMISGGAMIGGGYPMGAMMGSMMGGGYPMGGMMGMPMGAMISGGGMMGMPMSGGMMGMPMSGGMMGSMMGDGGMAQMQYYQQMQQMQMQQYQMMMQQQNAKNQAMMGLQSEYQSLLQRMAQVQMGIGIGSIGIGGGLGMGTGIIGSGMGGGTITGPGGSITGPGIINGNGSYLPGGGGTGPIPVNQGSGLGNSTR